MPERHQTSPHPAETDPAGREALVKRGSPQLPNTAEGAGSSAVSSQCRVLSVKLDLTDAQWKRLRELAWQMAQYKNHFIRARWAEAIGLRVDPEKGDKTDVSKHVRKHHKGELSGSAYSAAEREVQAVWQRDGKKIMAGAPMSQWREKDALSIRGHKNRDESGVRIIAMDNRLFADLQVQSKDCDGGCWIRVRIAKGAERDERQSEILEAMARGSIAVAKGTVVFVATKGRCYLKIAYESPVAIPPMGARVATLGPVHVKGRRMLLRTETATIDYTQELHVVMQRKSDWDAMRRRVYAQIGRRRGSARRKREHHVVHNSFDEWCSSYLHQWTAKLVKWCQTQGVGRIVLCDLAGGDWPAHKFEEFVRYKAHDAGMTVDCDASLEDAGTERAAKSLVQRERRKSKKIGEAIRTLATNV